MDTSTQSRASPSLFDLQKTMHCLHIVQNISLFALLDTNMILAQHLFEGTEPETIFDALRGQLYLVKGLWEDHRQDVRRHQLHLSPSSLFDRILGEGGELFSHEGKEGEEGDDGEMSLLQKRRRREHNQTSPLTAKTVHTLNLALQRPFHLTTALSVKGGEEGDGDAYGNSIWSSVLLSAVENCRLLTKVFVESIMSVLREEGGLEGVMSSLSDQKQGFVRRMKHVHQLVRGSHEIARKSEFFSNQDYLVKELRKMEDLLA